MTKKDIYYAIKNYQSFKSPSRKLHHTKSLPRFQPSSNLTGFKNLLDLGLKKILKIKCKKT